MTLISYANVPDLADIVMSGGIHFIDPSSKMLLIVTDHKMKDKQTYLLYQLSLKMNISFVLHPKIGGPGETYEDTKFKLLVDRFTMKKVDPVILHVRFAPESVVKGETIYIGISEESFFPGKFYGRLELKGFKWLYPRNDHIVSSKLLKNVLHYFKNKDGMVACVVLNEMGMKNLVELLNTVSNF